MASARPADSDSSDDTWRELQRLLDDVTQAARSAVPAAEFFSLLVDRTLRATGARAALLWTRTADGRFQPEFHRHGEHFRLAEDRLARELHAQLLDTVPQLDDTHWIPAGSGSTSDVGGRVNRGDALSLTPLRLAGTTFAVLELAHGAEDDPTVERACREIIAAFTEQAATWRRGVELAEWRQRGEFARECDQFVLRIHAALDLPATMGEIVQGTRRLVGCDRVTLAVRSGREWRIEMVSGLETVDRRSTVINALERFLNTVARTGESFEWAGAATELPGEVAEPLNAYLDLAHPRTLVCWPLVPDRWAASEPHGTAEPLGILVLERFAGGFTDDQRGRLERVARHAAQALGNAWEYATLPGASWLRGLRAFTGADRRLRRRRLLGCAIALAIVAAVLVWPVPFTVSARGALQPRTTREIFATADGEVSRILVDPAAHVELGQPLLQLASPELDLEWERLRGEYQTTREKLLAVESSRLLDAQKGRDSATDAAASEAELRRALESLEAQLAILEQQRRSLALTSPLAGAVLTWDPRELLEARPVKRGQALLTVGDVDGAWEARLDIPDHAVGHVVEAQAASEQPLRVTLVLATAPGSPYEGQLSLVEGITGSDEEGRPTVKARVALDQAPLTTRRPGATVQARVHCGRRALGYVWFHELFEFLQAQLATL